MLSQLGAEISFLSLPFFLLGLEGYGSWLEESYDVVLAFALGFAAQ